MAETENKRRFKKKQVRKEKRKNQNCLRPEKMIR